MLRTPVSRTFAFATAATRAAPASLIRGRTLATVPPPPPDPTHPTDGPKPTDKPSSNSTMWIVVAATGAGLGAYWWSTREEGESAHDTRLKEEERMKAKAKELKDAGKATAHSAVREGEAGYEQAKVRLEVRRTWPGADLTDVL